MNILLVEDEVITARVMAYQFQKIGYNITHHVVTGEEAVDYVKLNSPDLILMDIRLAGKIDGIEAAEMIIKSETGIPIVFITGYEDSLTKVRAEKFKPLGYYIKPIDLEKLKNLLNNHFENGNINP